MTSNIKPLKNPNNILLDNHLHSIKHRQQYHFAPVRMLGDSLNAFFYHKQDYRRTPTFYVELGSELGD